MIDSKLRNVKILLNPRFSRPVAKQYPGIVILRKSTLPWREWTIRKILQCLVQQRDETRSHHITEKNLDDFIRYFICNRRKFSRFGAGNQKKNVCLLFQGSDVTRRSLKPRVITRRHLRAPRQVLAAHYGADSALFGMEDEHTGNGRAKHNEGIFKAWRPSDWVNDLGMGGHFTLSRDGRLTVHEPGLYIVYAQIHYLDEHDENGFHILVNGHPILQCLVRSYLINKQKRYFPE